MSNIIANCPNCDCEFFPEDIANDDFDNVLLSMLGKSHRLTKEEEEIITKIAEKFKYG